MRSKEELARVTDPGLIDLAGMIRSWDVKLTSKAQWQVAGEQMPDDAGRLVREVRNAEVYSGIGFYARPARLGTLEAIVAFLSADANSPTIVAARDEKTRTAVVGDLSEDQTAVFNSRAAILIKDGTIEVGAGSAAQRTLKGDTYRSAEDTMLTAVSAAIGLIASIPGLTPAQAATVAAATAAITNFQAAGSGYLTTVAKVQ